MTTHSEIERSYLNTIRDLSYRATRAELMPREFSPADIQALFSVLNFIEREELSEALCRSISDEDWTRFPANFPSVFRYATDGQRESLAGLINSKLGA